MQLKMFGVPWKVRSRGCRAARVNLPARRCGQGSLAASAALPYPCQLAPQALIASALRCQAGARGDRNVRHERVDLCLQARDAHDLRRFHRDHQSGPSNNGGQGRRTSEQPVRHLFRQQRDALTFYKGTAASGTYVVIQNFARIPEKKLVKIAKAINGNIADGSGSSGGTLIP